MLVPGGKPVKTPDPSITVAAMAKAGQYEFTLTVIDDAGLTASALIVVTVRPG